jgi:hypothetical protein
MIGPREELVEQLKTPESAGLDQIVLNPPMDGLDENLAGLHGKSLRGCESTLSEPSALEASIVYRN